jgi:hypothetical protein
MRNRKRAILVVALAFVGTIAGAIATLRAARSAIGPVRVEVVSLRPVRARPSNPAWVDDGAPPDARREILQGHELLGDLERDFGLTREQRSALEETLCRLAGLQAQIDGLPDARERAVWQGRLVNELIVALRDVVRDHGLEPTLAGLAAKQPRLLYEPCR